MRKEEAISLLSKKLKLVRIENGYTQERMAEIVGLSKKTLVQIEKERILPSWTTVVAICALFRESEVLVSSCGGDPLEFVTTVARHYVEYRKGRTMGGKAYWNEIDKNGIFLLQQNMISLHYRILDDEDYRCYSTFHKGKAEAKLRVLGDG